MRAVLLPDDLIIKSLADRDPRFRIALLQQFLCQIGMECAENIARAEVHPFRMLPRFPNHRLPVVLRQMIPFLFPFLPVRQTLCSQFHDFKPSFFYTPLLSALSIASHSPHRYAAPSARS